MLSFKHNSLVVVAALLCLFTRSATAQADGSFCTANGDCTSNVCAGSRCCLTGMASQCKTCAVTTGFCTNCDTGYFVDAGNSCMAKKAAGVACTANAECSSALCSGGVCVIKIDGDYCTTNSHCVNNYCRTRCCNAGMSTNCNKCDCSGKLCISCFGSYYVSDGNCVAQKALAAACAADAECTSQYCNGGVCAQKTVDGETCTGNQCASGKCAGSRCCKAGTPTWCTSCDATGTCNACAAIKALVGSDCVDFKSNGQPCATDVECYGICDGGTCANKKATGVACSADAHCNSQLCTGGVCVVKAVGEACAGSQCTNFCIGSTCCKAAVTTKCSNCDNAGDCTSCGNAMHYVSGGVCITAKTVGTACTTNAECQSKFCSTTCAVKSDGAACTQKEQCSSNYKCLDSKCCKSGTHWGCTACDSSGDCSACQSGKYLLINGATRTCETVSEDGAECAADSHCTNGKCASRCCTAGMASQCTACSQCGTCETCSTGFYINAGSCSAKKNDGSTCSADVQCSSSRCNTTCCKVSVASQCTTCDSSGDCIVCDSGFFVESGSCTAKKGDGTSCSADVQCTSSRCNTTCCKSTVGLACTECDANGNCVTVAPQPTTVSPVSPAPPTTTAGVLPSTSDVTTQMTAAQPTTALLTQPVVSEPPSPSPNTTESVAPSTPSPPANVVGGDSLNDGDGDVAGCDLTCALLSASGALVVLAVIVVIVCVVKAKRKSSASQDAKALETEEQYADVDTQQEKVATAGDAEQDGTWASPRKNSGVSTNGVRSENGDLGETYGSPDVVEIAQ